MPNREKPLILIVDDTEGTRYSVARVLKNAGYDIIEAANGTDGLKLADERLPDLAILDIHLPDMLGFEVCRRIKAEPKTHLIPVLQISASYVTAKDKVNGLEGGADTYLTHPVEPPVLVATVRALLRLRDLTRNLERAKLDAELANEAKSQFIANITHEIRTPLGVIMGFSDLILDGGQDTNENLKSVAVIRRNAVQLSKIIDDVLDLSKLEADKVTIERLSFDVRALIEDVVSVMTLKAEDHGVRLSVAFEPILPRVVTSDPTRLRQILMNLIGNSIKFTERGEVKVFVGVEEKIVDGEPLKVSIQVKDTGIGIPKEKAALLFKPFSQADSSMNRRFGGTGLGLAVSRRLAEALGGGLELTESRPNEGSTFTAWFVDPSYRLASQKDPSPVPSPDKAPPTDSLSGMRILLVEDAPDNQVMIQRFLSFAGASVELASNGVEGVERAMNESFDLVFMDIQMPELNGYDAVRKLRELGYIQPVVALTAHALKGERDRCLSAGFTDYLTKPINRMGLIAKAQSIRDTKH